MQKNHLIDWISDFLLLPGIDMKLISNCLLACKRQKATLQSNNLSALKGKTECCLSLDLGLGFKRLLALGGP